MIDPQWDAAPGASTAPARNRRQDPCITLQELVLDSSDVMEFLAALAGVAAAVLSTITNTLSCGVTLRRRKRSPAAAGSDERGRVLEELQNDLHDGPSLTALRDDDVILVPDTGGENRWRDSMDALRRNGIRSILAVPLDLAGEAEAVMSLYSTKPLGFSGPDITAAEAFADSAAKSLRLALRIAHLRHARNDLTAAMQSRSTIDTAVGIVMAQNRCSRDAAFKVLTRASNTRNVKLRDLAAQVIASVSGETDLAPYFDE